MRIFRRINSSKQSSGWENSGKLVLLRGYHFLLRQALSGQGNAGDWRRARIAREHGPLTGPLSSYLREAWVIDRFRYEQLLLLRR